MTKRQLIEALAPFPDDTEIVIPMGTLCDGDDKPQVVTEIDQVEVAEYGVKSNPLNPFVYWRLDYARPRDYDERNRRKVVQLQ